MVRVLLSSTSSVINDIYYFATRLPCPFCTRSSTTKTTTTTTNIIITITITFIISISTSVYFLGLGFGLVVWPAFYAVISNSKTFERPSILQFTVSPLVLSSVKACAENWRTYG